MIPRTHEENKFYKKQKVCYIWLKRFSTDDDNKKYHKVRDHCHYTEIYRTAAHSIYNGSTYDYHFMINELVNEIDGQFEC